MVNASDAREPLGRKLVFTAKAMREAFEETLAAAGGSLGTWVVLSALSDVGIVSQAVLASHVHLEGATITRLSERHQGKLKIVRETFEHSLGEAWVNGLLGATAGAKP